MSIKDLKDAELFDRTGVTKVEEEPQEYIGRIVRSTNHIYPLFATRKMAYLTSLLIILWGEFRVDHKTVVELIVTLL